MAGPGAPRPGAPLLPDTVDRASRELENAELLDVQRRRDESGRKRLTNVYRLRHPSGSRTVTGSRNGAATRVDAAGVAAPMPPGVAAPMRHEREQEERESGKETSPSPPPRAKPGPVTEGRGSDLVQWIAQEDQIPHALAADVVRRAQNDLTTKSSAAGRLRSSPEYRHRLLGDVRRDQRAEHTNSRKCPHGIVDGRKIQGSGETASRVCGDCEAASPAPECDKAGAS